MATQPTIGGFLQFIRGVMGINATVLPDASQSITDAYDIAVSIVNMTLNVVPQIYALAVYNLAGDTLLNWAIDVAGQTYFAEYRKESGLTNFQAGVVASASDESTSTSLATPEYMKQLTLSDLQNMKTPFGRQYLAFAQRYGPGAWGVN